MNLDDVAEEIRGALAVITGLRRPPWGVEKVTPPAALVGLPDPVDYHQTYVRGKDRYPDFPLVILAGPPTARTTRKRLAAYVDGSGPKSIVAALDSHTWTSCESVTVTSCEFDEPTFAGVKHLAAIFHLNITGKGA